MTMMRNAMPAADPELDLVLVREVVTSPVGVWGAWTKPGVARAARSPAARRRPHGVGARYSATSG